MVGCTFLSKSSCSRSRNANCAHVNAIKQLNHGKSTFLCLKLIHTKFARANFLKPCQTSSVMVVCTFLSKSACSRSRNANSTYVKSLIYAKNGDFHEFVAKSMPKSHVVAPQQPQLACKRCLTQLLPFLRRFDTLIWAQAMKYRAKYSTGSKIMKIDLFAFKVESKKSHLHMCSNFAKQLS